MHCHSIVIRLELIHSIQMFLWVMHNCIKKLYFFCVSSKSYFKLYYYFFIFIKEKNNFRILCSVIHFMQRVIKIKGSRWYKNYSSDSLENLHEYVWYCGGIVWWRGKKIKNQPIDGANTRIYIPGDNISPKNALVCYWNKHKVDTLYRWVYTLTITHSVNSLIRFAFHFHTS